MKRKKWDSKTKWHIVIEGFRGRAMAEICVEYNVAQSQYYKWRDQFLTEGYKLFDIAKTDQKQLDVERENKKLKNLVGELAFELKKSEELQDY